MSEAQLLWLRDELKKSTAKWKVVYGHDQVYSAVRGDNDDPIERLLPILEENRVDLYLCGHEHLFQHLKRAGSVHYFVNGAAGGGGRPWGLKPAPGRACRPSSARTAVSCWQPTGHRAGPR
jgi:hypothetical protein